MNHAGTAIIMASYHKPMSAQVTQEPAAKCDIFFFFVAINPTVFSQTEQGMKSGVARSFEILKDKMKQT